LSEGERLNSQPENTLRHACSPPVSRTNNCTKAAVSLGNSHTGVRSQDDKRTITLPSRRDSPGFIVKSCETLFRLFSRPIVATRSANGVPEAASIA